MSMQVNNKYKIGERVYFINDKKQAECDEIQAVFVYFWKERTRVSYSMKSSFITVDESDVFATPADVKEHVFKDLIEFV